MQTRYYMEHNKIPFYFILCWLAYFSAYLGRLNYAAAMAEIIRAEGFSNAACGLVGTGFFICYGAGQLVSGFAGDKVSPKWMIFTGLAASSLCNLAMGFAVSSRAMLVIWCVNGIVQSMTWPPVLRIFSEYFPPEYRKKACVNISLTYPVGTLVVYGLCAGLVYVSGWRSVFFVSSGLVAFFALLWILGSRWMERFRTVEASPEAVYGTAELQQEDTNPRRRYTLSLLAAIAMIGLALALQGLFRDGMMTWIPTYLSNTYGVSTAFSIFSTTLLPIVNLGGVYLASFINRKLRKNELETSFLFFAAAGVAQVLIVLLGGIGFGFSLAAFAVITCCMTGINMMLVSFAPTYFAKWGNVSFMSGLFNAMVYIGSSIATYGIGAVVDRMGWGVLMGILVGCALLGMVACVLGNPGWKKFLSNED